jgi:hypothetical protein
MSTLKNTQTIVDVLISVAGTVDWLTTNPTVSFKSVPEEQLAPLRQLEMLGLITRSSGGVLKIQRERMKKVVNRALSHSPNDRRLMALDIYKEYFPTPESDGK